MNFSGKLKQPLSPVDATSLQNSPLMGRSGLGKVLLIYVAPEDSNYQMGGKGFYKIVRRPQLGFVYISGTLKRVGIDHDILDQTCELFDERDIIRICREENVAWVGFYTVDALILKVTLFLQRIRKALPEQLLVVGGPGTLLSRPYLDAGADIAVLGEGEYASIELCEYAAGLRDLEDIQNIVYLRDKQIVQTAPREPADLDLLPHPNRDLIDVNMYRDLLIVNNRLPYTTMITSRGCPFTCSFCTSPTVWTRKVRQRSVNNVLEEIDILVSKYGIKYISFQDDIFGLSKRWLVDFCRQLSDRKYDLNWMCILHPTSFRNHRGEMLDHMKEAGLNTISIGVQSADPEVLGNISRREEETELGYELIQEAKARQILTGTAMIVGLPGDTEETIQRSLDFTLRCRPHHAMFYKLTVLKGSPLDTPEKSAIKCSLTNEELQKWVRRATLRFNFDPKVFGQMVVYILRNNPRWLWTAVKVAPTLIGVLGLLKTNGARPDKSDGPPTTYGGYTPLRGGIRSC